MEPDAVRAHALGVRYCPPPPVADVPPAPRTNAARNALRLFLEHDRRTLRGCAGCWSINQAWAAAERWAVDAAEQDRRYRGARSWVVTLAALVVIEAGAIAVLGAVFLGYLQ